MNWPRHPLRVTMPILEVKMAWRELRAHWRRFIFFVLSVSVGVSAVVAVEQVSENVAEAIHGDAKSLLGGDLALTLSHPLGPAGRQVMESLSDRGIAVIQIRELVAMASDVPSREQNSPSAITTQLVEVKAVPNSYPLFGTLEISPPQSLAQALAPRQLQCGDSICYGALVEESLLFHLQNKVGSTIKLGQGHLKITGILVKEPDRVVSAFRLGPRIMISHEALTETGLVQPGSRIRERYLLRVPSTMSLETLAWELRARLANEGVRVTTYHNAQPRVRRFLDQLTTYLKLIGLTALFIAGIGIALTIQGHLANHMINVAILKTIGADSKTIGRIYVMQSVLIAIIGCVGGIGLGAGIQAGISWFLNELMSITIPRQLSLIPIVKGMVIGLSVSTMFTLWPLLAVRHIPPALVLRRHSGVSSSLARSPVQGPVWRGMASIFADRPRLLIGTGIGSCLIGLAFWQAGSWSLALFFVAVIAIATIIFVVLARILVRMLLHVSSLRSSILRCVFQNLARPGGHTIGIIVAIGLSVMLITCLLFSKHALVHALERRIPATAPSFFFIDIQPDQRVAFEQLLQRETGEHTFQLTPVIRSRLVAINGVAIDPETYRGKRHGWYFTREYVLTALERIPDGNTIVQGRWWKGEEAVGQDRVSVRSSSPILVSVEEEAARHLHVDVGDTLTFNVQGMLVSATVSSLRRVDWSTFSTNFFMILSPGSLSGLPMTYIATAHVDDEKEIPLQRALVNQLPNITAIKVGDVLRLVIELIQRVAWAVEGLGLFCLINGALVLAAALSSTWYRRIFESAMLKVFGATRGMILRIFAVEFLVLGTLAGLVGMGIATGLSWAIVRYFLDITWTFDPGIAGLAFAFTVLFAFVLGFFGTYRLLAYPPLRVLREE